MSGYINHLLLAAIPQEHRWKLILFQRWDSIIGTLKDKVKIEKIQNDALFLTVCHPSWAQELYMLSNLLKKKINTALQEERIKIIRFNTSKFTPTVARGEINSSLFTAIPVNDEISHVTLSTQERTSLNHVACDDLKSVLEKFYVRCHKVKKGSTTKGTSDEKKDKPTLKKA